jgi:hypothetical protein
MNAPVKPQSLRGASVTTDEKDYALSLVRVISSRLETIKLEVNAVGVALSRGMITPGEAFVRIEEIAPGCLDAVALTAFEKPKS